uniref:Uncharacterized protein n=1 Tax=viral metagenome TaxID=1070528 RepID=A0A6C0LS93_9ZZZZ
MILIPYIPYCISQLSIFIGQMMGFYLLGIVCAIVGKGFQCISYMGVSLLKIAYLYITEKKLQKYVKYIKYILYTIIIYDIIEFVINEILIFNLPYNYQMI